MGARNHHLNPEPKLSNSAHRGQELHLHCISYSQQQSSETRQQEAILSTTTLATYQLPTQHPRLQHHPTQCPRQTSRLRIQQPHMLLTMSHHSVHLEPSQRRSTVLCANNQQQRKHP